MPRRKNTGDDVAAVGVLESPRDKQTHPALDIRPDAVYTMAQVRAALGLRASSLRSEWRQGRLRVVRRWGRNYLLGRDVLAWLNGGEVPSPAKRHRVNVNNVENN